MSWTLDDLTESELVGWIERNASKLAAHAQGYQGQVYLYESEGRRLIVKVAAGDAPMRWVREAMLRHEARVYQHLAGFRGAPRCHGLLRDRYLVLEYVDGTPLREAHIEDRAAFFDVLLAQIKELHRRGVAHADLKRQDNLMVVGEHTPCLIDFGAAIIRKPGFAPLNHYLYELACKFDFNAWAKLKYDGRFDEMSQSDRIYYNRTGVEKFARAVKRGYLQIKPLVRTLTRFIIRVGSGRG